MLAWGQDMYDRFLQILEGYPAVYDSYTQFQKDQQKMFKGFVSSLPSTQLFSMLKVEKPSDGLSTEEAEAQNIIVSSDQRPVKTKPSDVYVDVPDLVAVQVATISASGSATTVTIVEERDRVFSECAKQKGLSLCIRTETLWPQAIAGFKRSPLFVSGYATLNKTKITDFIEADSTDNNFLRTLGETGLLGFITFYGAVAIGILYSIRAYLSKDTLLQTLAAGYLAGSIGLLINAIYIDVYASSKVALTLWMLTGILLAFVKLDQQGELVVALPSRQPTQARQPKVKKSAKVRSRSKSR
jgi:hypothetical protein